MRYGRGLVAMLVGLGVFAGALTFAAPAKASGDKPRLGFSAMAPAVAGPVNSQSVIVAPFPLAETFKLHSAPGADRVIYIDFDGDTLTNTGWNDSYDVPSMGAPAWDIDENPSSFSDTERAAIQEVWMRVAEDYAPFKIDVTTEAPTADALDRANALDTKFGTTALVSDTPTIANECGCGGVGWVGVFDAPGVDHAYYQPALVFPQNVANSARNIAEVVSHEVGHNLGLSHDGTSTLDYYAGQGAWAPIMGSGFSRPVTQWDNGAYSGSDNSESDITVMLAHGAPAVTDDHSDTTSGATALNLTGQGKGVIGTAADVDVFSFIALGGSVTIGATPAPVGPNLDIKLDVLDQNGTVVVSADPAVAALNSLYASGLDASITTTLAAGTYFVRVQGVGFGNPATTGYSDYGSLGQYSVSATGAIGLTRTISINDTIVGEGNSGTSNATFTVTMSSAASEPVSFLATAATGTASSGTDYSGTPQTITIPAGQTSVNVPVAVVGDTTPEAHETFGVWLGNVQGATALKAVGQAVIINDDGIGVSITNVDQAEGSGQFTAANFTVSLSMKAPYPVSVQVTTGNGTALPVTDFGAFSTRVFFAKGEQTKTVTVVIRGDRVVEPDEKYTVWLSAPIGVVVTKAMGVGTIRNDD